MSGHPPSHFDAQSAADLRFMAAALALGRRGLGRTASNPSVGALVVADGIVLGRGFTGDGGRPHGEIVALAQAGPLARGATLYVTLEPCSHHGRSGPCCEAIVAAGVARLVYALDDPNPLVAGRGATFCRTHGIEVVRGIGAEAAGRDHHGHILRMTADRPLVTLKLAETLDGFVAGGPHDPRLAITGAAANGAVHVMRAMYDAVMVGIGTVQADDPLMTVRLPGVSAKPLRIVLDARLDISPRSRLLRTASDVPVLLVAREDAPCPKPLADLPGVEILRAPGQPDGRFDLPAVLRLLAERGLTRIFSEGGPKVAEALLAQDLVDDVLLFTAARPWGGDGVKGLEAASRERFLSRFDLIADTSVGADRLRHYELKA